MMGRSAAGGSRSPVSKTATVRVAIYARYSSENQRGESIEDQVRLCTQRVTAEGWSITKVFKDAALSGASTRRPGYQDMLDAAQRGGLDIIVAESLDRLSRDQEDIAHLFKRLNYMGVKLVTVSEGAISALHVGLKGTMNAMFLDDLADKTHRGLLGRVEAGFSAGGNSYGYKVVRRLDQNGKVSTGEREIDEAEAQIVRRIFAEYAAGKSPKAIAVQLNEKSISAPRGGTWSPSTINGNRARGTGILNNELYVGRLVWNRLSYVKNPDTDKRCSRLNGASEVKSIAVPDLAIVNDDLWEAVRKRQEQLGGAPGRSNPDGAAAAPWQQQRPRHLFSGLMRCGSCGGGFSKISKTSFGCSTARNKGAAVCTNKATIRCDALEAVVLDGLRARLMQPEMYQEFARAFVEEWNRGAADRTATTERLKAELCRVEQKIGRLVDAIADGAPMASVRAGLMAAEQRQAELRLDLAQPTEVVPRLHPALAEVYQKEVASLSEALDGDDATEARELVRGLVETVTLHPEDGGLRVEVRGELSKILALGAGPGGPDCGALAVQMKMVAGTRSHLYRTKFGWPEPRGPALSQPARRTPRRRCLTGSMRPDC